MILFLDRKYLPKIHPMKIVSGSGEGQVEQVEVEIIFVWILAPSEEGLGSK